MHTDEDGTNLPISLARPMLLAYTRGTHTHMHMHKHTPEQKEGTQKLLHFPILRCLILSLSLIYSHYRGYFGFSFCTKLNVEVCLLMSVCQKGY